MTTQPAGKNPFEEWIEIRRAERTIGNDHYPFFFTTHFDLTLDFYRDKRILDVGCGPRGSLEWADMAAERVGLDPIAPTYLAFGADRHKMRYVADYAEDMSFADAHFDVVSAFYTLDHIHRLAPSAFIKLVRPVLTEIRRVLKPGGLFLLLTDLHYAPDEEPARPFAGVLREEIAKHFDVQSERRYERPGYGIFDSIEMDIPYDPTNRAPRYAILSLKARRAKD